MAWTRSGHSLRSNSRSSHLSGSIKSCFRLNRFKLAAGWVYYRRRAFGVSKNTLKANRIRDSDKCENAQGDAMDQLSIVTRYHMLIRSSAITRDNYDLMDFEPSESTCCLDVSQQPVQQCTKPSGKSFMFDDDMKWKEVWSSFLGCPYSEIHKSRANRNLILLKMQNNERKLKMNGAKGDFKFNHTNDSTANSQEVNSPLANRLIILKGPDNGTKTLPSTSINLSPNKSKDCFPCGNGHCDLTAADGNLNSNPSSSRKNWSLFRISNGSIIPLYWVQNDQNSPNRVKTESISSDLKVNNANWFTKSVLSNLVGQTSQSTASSHSNNIVKGFFHSPGGFNHDYEKESDSQKLVRSCHEFVYDNSGSQIHRCKSCTKLFTSLAAFCDHVISTHNQAKNRCGVCHKHFSRSWLLKGHMRTHTGERPYKCHHPGCNKAFADKSNLRSHTLIHTVVGKKFVCQRCHRAFAQKRYLHKHQFEVCKILT